MGKNFLLCATLLSTLGAQGQKFTDHVDPMIGSGGHGHVFVGANVPYGAVQVGPSGFYKGWDWCSGYNYRDSMIIGFPQLHLSGTGIGDLGDILIMPYMGGVKLQKGVETERYSGYASKFSHRNETARPGYYKVKLDDHGIDVELTASERVAFHRYTFPQGGDARVIIDLMDGINDKSTDTYIELADKYTIKGYRSSEGWAKRQQVFFAIRLSVPVTDFTVWDDTAPVKGRKGRGKSIKGLISFATSPGTIQMKVGISPVSADNALANIAAEIPGWDFAAVVEAADRKWNEELGKIEVETGDQAHKRIFYTSMFHLMAHPSLFNDADGGYMGADWKARKNPGFDNYTIFSLWDTYRAAHPVFTMIDPRRTADFVNSMLAIFDQTGMLPIWHLRGYETGTMVGINSFQVIAEACLKGVEGFDAERAFEALKASAMSGARGLDFDRDMKPIPSDVMRNRPVATALEYAIGTASIAEMARKMGKTDDYEYFKKRSENYKLYYDRATGFFRGRMSDGSWNPVFDPVKSVRPWATDYAEGNAWQYLWLVPHDVEGLIDLVGGESAFTDRLDTFFTLDNSGDPDVLVDLTGTIGQYAHGNEPSHHIAYLYAYAGRQWQTARLTRRIMNEFYHDRPDGIIGNEDCGQMSAWYVLSSLGFYPVFTASGQYVLGSPLFDKATINLENGKKFTIEATGNSADNIYIQSAELNGKPYDLSYITHDDITRGGTLRLVMGAAPDYDFGAGPTNRPRTGSSGSVFASKPFVHPGMAQSRDDLDLMKENILKGVEPWKSAFDELKKQTGLDFVPRPVAFVSEGPYGANSVGGREFSASARAVYAHALIWYVTGGKAHADKAIEILNAWSQKLRSFDANNAKLNVGLWGYYYLNAAEILRYSDAGWSAADMKRFDKMVMGVLYPTIRDFFTEANGNWDASMISTMLCMGVWMDDREIFNRAIDRYYWGIGNSGITKYIYPGGQSQEATRDWDHVQLGVGEFGKAAQTASTQGLDLYSVAQDRLAQGYELTAKMMLEGQIDVYGVLSKRNTERYKDIYEAIHGWYANVRGIELPYTRRVIETQTRAQFPMGFLTATKKYSAPTGKPLTRLPEADFLKPTQTGALDHPTGPVDGEGIVVVEPGSPVQQAVDANRGNGKTILLARGVHTLDAPLKIYSGTTLAGHGKESILFLAPRSNTATIVGGEEGLVDVTIRDLLIEGAVSTVENNDPNHDRRGRSYMSAPSREGVVIRSERGAEIRNLLFENVTIQNFTRNGVLIVGASDVTILRCNFSDNGGSVVPGAGAHHNLNLSYVTGCRIIDSRFDTSPWGSGVSVTSSRRVEISGGEMSRNALSGIYCADSEDVVITGNLTEGNDRDGIATVAMTDGCRDVTIEGNISQNNGGAGISTEKVQGLRLTNNRLHVNKQ
jgi:predicted alpha-1,2-mannosidase